MAISQLSALLRTCRCSAMQLAGAALIIALFSVLHHIGREMTTFINDYTHVDEIFFAVCAASGWSGGDVPVSGCHDNKAPLIYLFYQAIELVSGRFSLIGIKTAGALCALAAIGAVGWVAHRLGGALAALISAALAAQALAINPELLAFKTELVGTIFLLMGASTLLSWRRLPKGVTLFYAGLWFGLAVMTKQTFAFGAFGVWLWLMSCPVVTKSGGLWVRARWWLLFNSALLIPMLVFVVIFFFRGQILDFSGSVFLHAAAYGTGGTSLSWSERAWKLGWILQQFGLVYPLTIAFVAALAHWLWTRRKSQAIGSDQDTALGLLFSLALCMALIPVIARQYFQPHLLPAWLLMAVAAGASIATWLKWGLAQYASSDGWQAATATTGLFIAVLMAVNSWYSNGDATERAAAKQHVLDAGSRIPDARGKYGYVLGIRPEFYFFNGIIPASDVLYPAALMRATHAVSPDQPVNQNKLRARLNSAMQTHAAKRLMDAFAKTPPSYIFVVDKWARTTNPADLTDVVVLNDYVRSHCAYVRTVAGKPYQTGRLFVCEGDTLSGRLPVGTLPH